MSQNSYYLMRWLSKCLDIEDPTILPDVITELVGKTFRFVVSVERENLGYGHDNFKVVKVLSSADGLEDQIDGMSERMVNASEITSRDHVPLLLINTDDDSSSSGPKFTTPTSKRRNDVNDELYEVESTTKKGRRKSSKLKQVKIEDKKD